LNPVDGIGEVHSGNNRTLSIAVEVGVASAIRNSKNNIVIQFAATDSGMEWACDVTSSQAIAALVSDPRSQWGELFKRMVTQIRRIPSRRGGMSQQGVRFAARRLVFQVQPMWDFVPGQVPSLKHPVWDFIKLARAQPLINQVDVAGIVEGLMIKDPSPNWRIAQAQLGLTQAGIIALNAGIPLGAPFDDPTTVDPDEFTPVLTELTVADGDQPPGEQTSTGPITAPPPEPPPPAETPAYPIPTWP